MLETPQKKTIESLGGEAQRAELLPKS